MAARQENIKSIHDACAHACMLHDNPGRWSLRKRLKAMQLDRRTWGDLHRARWSADI